MANDLQIRAFPPTNILGTVIPMCCNLFSWDPRVVRSTMVQYILLDPILRPMVVPGDARICSVVSEKVTISVAALIYWASSLHSLSFCYSGPLTVNHFVIEYDGSIKGTTQLLDMLVPLNEGLRTDNMVWLADFARLNLYRIPAVGQPPREVQHLLNILMHFTRDQYLLIKSHPAITDPIEKSAMFEQLYAKLLAVRTRNPQLYHTIIGMNINHWSWVCRAMSNVFLHQLVRFSSNSSGSLTARIMSFLSSPVKYGQWGAEDCLRVRRNGDAHLLKDYCGEGVGDGTLQALHAAIAAATEKIPGLANLPLHVQNYGALRQILRAPFTVAEATVIATVITDALSRYTQSREQAEAAATAAAVYVVQLPMMYLQTPPKPTSFVPPQSVPPQNVVGWQNHRVQKYTRSYQRQRRRAAAVATNAAQQVPAIANPMIARNMFDVKDKENFFELMEPILLSSLHKAMFDQNEMQDLQWHWERTGVKLNL